MTFTQGPQFSHRTGLPWLTRWTPDLVANSDDPAVAACSYMEQILGIGFATARDLATLRKNAQQIFDGYPNANWHTICRVILYVKANRRWLPRFTRGYQVINMWRRALADGALPELTRDGCQQFEDRIRRILETETDPNWRARLRGCEDDGSRQFVLGEWDAAHA